MKRNPSLHITKSDLVLVLQEVNLKATTLEQLAEAIFVKSQPYQIRDRYKDILQLKSKTKQKVQKSQNSDAQLENGDVEIFQRRLTAERMKRNPYGKVRPILKDNIQYGQLKEIAVQAVNFSQHFDFKEVQIGMQIYIELGLDSMGKQYSLNKFKTYDEKIYQKYQSLNDLKADTRPEDTVLFYLVWQEVMKQYTQIESFEDLQKIPSKFVHFLYARQQAEENEAEYDDWLYSQFEGMAFMSIIPEIYQLHGEGAKARYDKYMSTATAPQEENELFTMYKNNEDEI